MSVCSFALRNGDRPHLKQRAPPRNQSRASAPKAVAHPAPAVAARASPSYNGAAGVEVTEVIAPEPSITMGGRAMMVAVLELLREN